MLFAHLFACTAVECAHHCQGTLTDGLDVVSVEELFDALPNERGHRDTPLLGELLEPSRLILRELNLGSDHVVMIPRTYIIRSLVAAVPGARFLARLAKCVGERWGATGWAVVAGWSVVLALLAARAYRRDTARV